MKKISKHRDMFVQARDIDDTRHLKATENPFTFAASTPQEEILLTILLKMPSSLRNALNSELINGNKISMLTVSGWPQEGSVGVGLCSLFKNDFSTNEKGLTYRVLNDPRCWIAGVHVTVEGVEHMITHM
jgi:hypothetical protein